MSPDPGSIAALSAALGTDPPPAFATLEPSVLAGLTEALAEAGERQSTELVTAVDQIAKIVPKPMRFLVRRALVG